MNEPWDEKPGWLIHRLRSVGEPGAYRDMCREAANLIAEWQVEIGRLRGHAGRLQGALHEIDVALLSPEAVERDTEIVGGPVPLYAVECDEAGVVRRVKAEIEKLRREVSESNREKDRGRSCDNEYFGSRRLTMAGENMSNCMLCGGRLMADGADFQCEKCRTVMSREWWCRLRELVRLADLLDDAVAFLPNGYRITQLGGECVKGGLRWNARLRAWVGDDPGTPTNSLRAEPIKPVTPVKPPPQELAPLGDQVWVRELHCRDDEVRYEVLVVDGGPVPAEEADYRNADSWSLPGWRRARWYRGETARVVYDS